MGNIKEINIKNRLYYFFDDMSDIKDFDPSLKIDEKSYKTIIIYYIGYITMRKSDHVRINSINPLYITINEVDRSIAEKMEVNTELLLLLIETKIH